MKYYRKDTADCFTRERRRLSNTRSGSSAAATRKSTYVYYEQLLFLQRVTTSKNTTSSMDHVESTIELDTPLELEQGHDSSTSSSAQQSCHNQVIKAKKKR